MKKDQEIIKQSNLKLLLYTLIENRPISRAQLAKKIKMSPASVTRLTAHLMTKGFIVETSLQSNGVGRHAIMLDTIASSAYAVGIDIKSNLIRLSLLNLHRQCVAMHSFSFDVVNSPIEEVINIMHSASIEFLEKNKVPYDKLTGVGVCVPGIVDIKNSIVEFSSQLKWKNQDIVTQLAVLFKKPIIIENDSKARIVGEKSLNNIPENIDAATLIIGNGVSAAAVSRSKIVRGVHNAAGEIGHITLNTNGMPCDCGKNGCLQTYLSDKFLIRTAKESDSSVETIDDIIAAYKNDKEWAVKIMSDFKNTFHLTLDILSSCYNPQVVIVSGNVVTYLEIFLKKWSKEFIDEKSTSKSQFHIVVAATKRNVAATGSAIIAFKKFIHTLMENE